MPEEEEEEKGKKSVDSSLPLSSFLDTFPASSMFALPSSSAEGIKSGFLPEVKKRRQEGGDRASRRQGGVRIMRGRRRRY